MFLIIQTTLVRIIDLQIRRTLRVTQREYRSSDMCSAFFFFSLR